MSASMRNSRSSGSGHNQHSKCICCATRVVVECGQYGVSGVSCSLNISHGSSEKSTHESRTQWMSSSVVPMDSVAGEVEPATGFPFPGLSHGWARSRATALTSDSSSRGCGPMSRQTGLPREVTTISSPARARRRYSDKWFFRSWTDTSMVDLSITWPFSRDSSHVSRGMATPQRLVRNPSKSLTGFGSQPCYPMRPIRLSAGATS